MKRPWIEKLKQLVRIPLYKAFHRGKQVFECPICGYRGPFKDKYEKGNPPRHHRDSKCVGCGAVERHRMQYLVFNEVLTKWNAAGKKVLHIAPELCLKPCLSGHFGQYDTADLLRKDVNFTNEDVQHLSFADGTYDCVCISRVLVYPSNVDKAISELRRILKPGGIAFIAEAYRAEKETPARRASRARVLGLDTLDLCRNHFARVDCLISNRYDAKYQLFSRIEIDGKLDEDAPDMLRQPGVGIMDLVAVCHA